MQNTPKSIAIVTYNIHKGFDTRRRFLLPEMREALSLVEPDVLFLQEVQGMHRKREKAIADWPDLPQFQYLSHEAWPHYVYAKNAVYKSGHHGNAILSKYPFSQSENVNLSTISRASRSILHARILWEGETNTTLHLLCVHLGLFKAERASQCQALMSRIEELIPENEPLIMAGDFNDWQKILSTPLAERLNISEAFHALEGEHARSFPALRPAFCVDRVYFRGLRVQGVQCLQGKPWRLLSDHLPLMARFVID